MDVLLSATRSLFRLELQPSYDSDAGEGLAEFLAGRPTVPRYADAWFDQVRAWRRAGVHVERVRVQHDPPTGYQRWERWVGAWNIDAGEDLRYLSRSKAFEVGLLPEAGTADWWLIDASTLLELHFDEPGRKSHNELTRDPRKIAAACKWRDLAVYHALPETFRGIAMQGIPT